MFTVEIEKQIIKTEWDNWQNYSQKQKTRKIEYQVDFDHYTKHTAHFYGQEGTNCSISSDNGKVHVARGKTVLHEGDNYDKNFGRKLSLARALKNGGFSTPERTLFWEAYFKARGKVN